MLERRMSYRTVASALPAVKYVTETSCGGAIQHVGYQCRSLGIECIVGRRRIDSHDVKQSYTRTIRRVMEQYILKRFIISSEILCLGHLGRNYTKPHVCGSGIGSTTAALKFNLESPLCTSFPLLCFLIDIEPPYSILSSQLLRIPHPRCCLNEVHDLWDCTKRMVHVLRRKIQEKR